MSSDEDLQKLTFIEQNLSSIVMQRQNFQRQVLEIESALEEIKNLDSAYQIVGQIMIKKPTKELREELNSKKSTISVRLESIQKKENELKLEMNNLQKNFLKNIDKGE